VSALRNYAGHDADADLFGRIAMRGVVKHHERLSAHTSWRVGGPADRYFEPADRQDLVEFVRALPPGEPVLWLGLGSNLLVRDGGVRGTVICLHGALDQLELRNGSPGQTVIHAEAGVHCARLAKFAQQHKRAGLGFMAGIPGTVGGALAMNAGAHGGETWERVQQVRTIDRAGVVHERSPEDYRIAYRSVTGPRDEWFIEATFEFDAGTDASMDRLKAMLDRRKATQPLGLPSCGSVFRNPPGDHAARLIESAGLKGYRVGGAEVSEKHGNFIINRDHATAADIEAIINHVQRTVRERYGIELVHEVRIVGRQAT
jgi:UDP-N-acetylmuramate dehydrogenase